MNLPSRKGRIQELTGAATKGLKGLRPGGSTLPRKLKAKVPGSHSSNGSKAGPAAIAAATAVAAAGAITAASTSISSKREKQGNRS